MEDQSTPITLLPDYEENALYLLVQSPTVLYVYWELSPGLKSVLNEKTRVRIRLNAGGRGPLHNCAINLLEKKSYYFLDVEPGQTYNCEIGIINSGEEFYPLLRSNSATTPHDRPEEGADVPEGGISVSSLIFSIGSHSYGGKNRDR